MSKSIDKIFKQIQKESEQLAVGAMIQVKRDMVKLVKEEARSCMEKYYAWKPKRYKRTGALAKVWEVKQLKDEKVASASGFVIILRYDSRKLQGLYKSKSRFHQSGDKWRSRLDSDFKFDSGDNGIPEPDWILKNYMAGVHPSGFANVDGFKDAENTDEHMTEFFNNVLPSKVNDLAVQAMTNAVLNYLKK